MDRHFGTTSLGGIDSSRRKYFRRAKGGRKRSTKRQTPVNETGVALGERGIQIPANRFSSCRMASSSFGIIVSPVSTIFFSRSPTYCATSILSSMEQSVIGHQEMLSPYSH